MTSNILLMDCSNLQSIYDVMIAIWRYETKGPVAITIDVLVELVLEEYKKDDTLSDDSVARFLEEEYGLPMITDGLMRYFATFCRHVKIIHESAKGMRGIYHYICLKDDTIYLELE